MTEKRHEDATHTCLRLECECGTVKRFWVDANAPVQSVAKAHGWGLREGQWQCPKCRGGEGMTDWPHQKRGEENPRARFSQQQAEILRDRYALGGVTIKQLQEETGAGWQTIRRIVKGERYEE